ncbi:hypothetical protein K503DRAFT_783380 [Rhizopogon vinicolor AM-OR11-026]|uniref:Uncharacterized protein n=1 Tax=Rhizopogon vinicolor AM-OR11-026 TaxID=1314800 RepID=A0A1B7MYX8_9AGAM|nr:hypothetical protein K503DRAFT_783380 [Rhizopogon vinicolor AM-OR11-026]
MNDNPPVPLQGKSFSRDRNKPMKMWHLVQENQSMIMGNRWIYGESWCVDDGRLVISTAHTPQDSKLSSCGEVLSQPAMDVLRSILDEQRFQLVELGPCGLCSQGKLLMGLKAFSASLLDLDILELIHVSTLSSMLPIVNQINSRPTSEDLVDVIIVYPVVGGINPWQQSPSARVSARLSEVLLFSQEERHCEMYCHKTHIACKMVTAGEDLRGWMGFQEVTSSRREMSRGGGDVARESTPY